MNIKYSSEETKNYYSSHRFTWEEFYESEKYIMDKKFNASKTPFTVLDVGCGCGGLGHAIEEKYKMSYYKGIDIDENEIIWAKKNSRLKTHHDFECLDILDIENETYDFVISLSCIDFNIEVDNMIEKCWDLVKPGGMFLCSVRLTDKESINDITRAYQRNSTETYNYVVFNLYDFLGKMGKLSPKPKSVEGYGYWCKPSESAVVEYDLLCMSMFCIEKPIGREKGRLLDDIKVCLQLPYGVLSKSHSL